MSLTQVDDPLLLPYRFQLEFSHTGPAPTDIVPVDIDGNGTLESYHVQTDRHTVAGLSSIVFYDCLDCGSVREQYNYDHSRITETKPLDADQDGDLEFVVLFVTRDTLFVEILSPDSGRMFRAMLGTGLDRNGDGNWDGHGYFAGFEDFTGDGTPELLLVVDVGFDLYTRKLICLDWKANRTVWDFTVAGIVAYTQIILTKESAENDTRLVFGVASKGNAAVANGMDDLHSYLIGLDRLGRQTWRRITGGEFTNPMPISVRSNETEGPLIVYASSYLADSLTKRREWSLVTCDLRGVTIDSLPIDGDRRVRSLGYFEDGLNREPSITFDLDDDTLRVFNHELEPDLKVGYSADINIQGFYDFLGNGTTQVFASTGDGRLWLLSHKMEPLAQFSGELAFSAFRIIPASIDDRDARLLVSAAARSENYIFRVVATPWYTVFYRKPWLATVAGVAPLVIIIVVIGTAMARVRLKNKVINAQREELECTLGDLREAQDRLVDAEKTQLMNDIAGGVAHEVRNALDPAVQCLHALQEEEENDRDRLRQFVQLTDKSVRRAVSMVQMIKELADLSKTPGTDEADLEDVIADALEQSRIAIDEQNVETRIDIDGARRIRCPHSHAVVLFSNLIRNGIDAMSTVDHRTLTIRASCSDHEVEVSVADTGPGVPVEQRRRIFDAFYSTKPTTGVGLGLTFARRIAELHDGALRLTETAGKGATFVVSLPVALDA